MPTTTAQTDRKHYRKMTPREMIDAVQSIIREVEREFGQDTESLNRRLEEEIGLSTGIDIIWGAMGCHMWQCWGPNGGIIPRPITPHERRPRVIEVYNDYYHAEWESRGDNHSDELQENLRKASRNLHEALYRASRNGAVEGDILQDGEDCKNKYQRAPESLKGEHKEVVRLLLKAHDGSHHRNTGKVTDVPW